MHTIARHMSRWSRAFTRGLHGSVITCSRNNERLILSSSGWRSPPPLLSLSFSSKAPGPSRLIDLSLCRFLRARVLWLFDLLYRIHVVRSFIHFSRSLSQRTFGRISRMAVSIRFVSGFEYALIAVGRYGSVRQTGETWEAALLKYSIPEYRRYSRMDDPLNEPCWKTRSLYGFDFVIYKLVIST